MPTEPESFEDYGTANVVSRERKEKNEVNPYDIFRLAKSILLVSAGIYLLLALDKNILSRKCR